MATFSGWEAAVLTKVGAPVTPINVRFLDAWQREEGGDATNNPLNTTLPEPGAGNYNSVGVKNYPSATVGAAATAATLRGGYPNIVAALKANTLDTSVPFSAGVIGDLNYWVSGRRSTAPSSYSNAVAKLFGATEGNSEDPLFSGKAALHTATAPVTAALGGWVGDLTGWLTSAGKLVLAYVLLIGVAGALLVQGLKGLGVPVPKLPKPNVSMPLPVPA